MSEQPSYEESRLNEYLEQCDKAQALRPLIDEVRYSLMGQTVEDISRGLDGTLDLELNNLIDRIASHIVNMKMYRDGGV